MEPEALYRQLGQLVAQVPGDLSGPGPISAETHRWLGRAAILVKESGDRGEIGMDHFSFIQASDGLQGSLRAEYAHKIVGILHRALARAEMKAPAAAQGAFIPTGARFDVFRVISDVLGEAKKDVLIVEAYMDQVVLTDFAPLAPEGVLIRLLADAAYMKPTLQPAVDRWRKQFDQTRPLEARTTAPGLLHDRLIFVDHGARTWSLSQSVNAFAARSPGSILRVDDAEIAKQKLEAYKQLWAGAQPI